MNPEYRRLAYEHAVLMALVRVAQERFLPLESADTAAMPIDSEDMPSAGSRVPEDCIIDVVLKIRRLADARKRRLQNFRMVEAPLEAEDEQEWEEASTIEHDSKKDPETSVKGKAKNSEGVDQAAAGNNAAQPRRPAKHKSRGR